MRQANIITERREILEAEIASAKDALNLKEAELAELKIAEKVFLRLSGGTQKSGSDCKSGGEARKRSRFLSSVKPRVDSQDVPSISNIILEALMDARQRGLNGMAPKELREYAQRVYQRDIGSGANTVASRMWRERKLISKNEETGLFYLPKEREDADNSFDEKPSAPSLFATQAKDREAGSGGGP